MQVTSPYHGPAHDCYQGAIQQLDAFSKMTPAELRSHDIHGDYESAIINVAIIFDKGLDEVVCDLQIFRAGRSSQVAA